MRVLHCRSYGIWDGGASSGDMNGERKERKGERIRRGEAEESVREATSRRSAQKVNRLPGLLVLLTNFSIHRRLPVSSTAFLFCPFFPFRAPPYPPFVQLISSRPRRSGAPMFGELLIPAARDSPPAPSSFVSRRIR